MNDEQLARHAAVALLDEAARSADTDRALGDLLRGVDPRLVPATSTVVRRSRTLWFAIAGVVAAGLISIVLVVNHSDSPSRIVGDTTPLTAPEATPQPATSGVPTPSTTPASTPPSTATSTSVSPTTPTRQNFESITTGPSGVWTYGVGGTSRLSTQPMAFAIRLPDGRVLAQHQSGYGDWTPVDTTPLVLFDEYDGTSVGDLLPGHDWGAGWIRLHDVNVVEGRTLLLYEMQQRPDPFGPDAGSLFVLDIKSGESTFVGEVGGWERWNGRLHLAINGWIVGEQNEQSLLTFSVGSTPAPTAPQLGLEMSYAECNECPRAYTVSHDGTLIGWLDGSDLIVTTTADLGVAATKDRRQSFALGNNVKGAMVEIDLEVDRAVLSRVMLTTQEPLRPLLVRLDGGDPAIIELTETRATFAPVPPATPVPIEPLVRPVMNVPDCAPTTAGEGDVTNGALFSHHRPNNRPVQLLASPTGGIGAPYAIVERYYTDQRTGLTSATEIVDINGRSTRVFVGPYGQGEVQFEMEDSSEMYMRTRGFDLEQLKAVVAGLTPRPAAAAVPGFDFTPPAGSGLTLMDESNGLNGHSVGSQCLLANGASVYAGLLSGDLVFQYAVALDWIPLPVVAELDGRIVRIIGNRGPATQALYSLTNATPEQWAEMTAATQA